MTLLILQICGILAVCTIPAAVVLVAGINWIEKRVAMHDQIAALPLLLLAAVVTYLACVVALMLGL